MNTPTTPTHTFPFLTPSHLAPLKPLQHFLQQKFLALTSSYNFTLFCTIYTIVLFYLLMKCTRTKNWKAKNRQLKTWKQSIKQKFFSFVINLPILHYILNTKFQNKLDKQQHKIIQGLQKNWDHRKVNALPVQGMNDDNLKKRIYQWQEKQKIIWNTGKLSGAIYPGQIQHMEKMNNFSALYLYHNPLHLQTYKQLLRMQKQVIDMTNSLITSKDKKYYGTVTSGGSQSLMLALYAYRNYYANRTKPNVVIPVTAHAAIDKGCFYLNIQARKVKLNAQYQADLSHMQSLIDSNTIMLLASAPNYPHGIIDPIDQISKLALKYNIGCHIDACLGGFIGTFDPTFKDLYSMDRQGVTSISLDHHKFGLAPKGISTIFYKCLELRQSQYYVNTEWKGGLYGTLTFPGSRSGFASAAGWYALTSITMKGYKQNAKLITQTTQQGAAKLKKIKGITVLGSPKLCVIAFTTTPDTCSPLALYDFLHQQRKWNLSMMHKPYAIHISITLANCHQIANLPKDVADGLQWIRSKGQLKQSMASTFYGTTTKIPTDEMSHDVFKLLLGACMK